MIFRVNGWAQRTHSSLGQSSSDFGCGVCLSFSFSVTWVLSSFVKKIGSNFIFQTSARCSIHDNWCFLLGSRGPVLQDSEEFIDFLEPLVLPELAFAFIWVYTGWIWYLNKNKRPSLVQIRGIVYFTFKPKQFWLPENHLTGILYNPNNVSSYECLWSAHLWTMCGGMSK
jgi:hypothetical protein